MKNIYLPILYGSIFILSLIVIFYRKSPLLSASPISQDLLLVYSNRENNTPSSCESFDALVQDLQPRYKLGYNNTYEPVPLSQQPNNALPFNAGLKPCTPVITV